MVRQMGIPVSAFTPGRGADKFSRMNACSPVFKWHGVVTRTRWSEEVIEECAAFPNGEHDDAPMAGTGYASFLGKVVYLHSC